MAKGSGGGGGGAFDMVRVGGYQRRVYESGGVQFVKDDIGGDYVVVFADVQKLDKAWRTTEPDMYIPPGGGGAEIGGRRQGFREFLAKKDRPPIQMPRVGHMPAGSKYNKSGGDITGFSNGRHRFSIFRDMGKRVLPVQVDRTSAKDFRNKYGAKGHN